MTARVSVAQARQLGLLDDTTTTKPAKTRRERWPYHTRCHRCGEEFTIEAAETRHNEATRHVRYELVGR